MKKIVIAPNIFITLGRTLQINVLYFGTLINYLCFKFFMQIMQHIYSFVTINVLTCLINRSNSQIKKENQNILVGRILFGWCLFMAWNIIIIAYKGHSTQTLHYGMYFFFVTINNFTLLIYDFFDFFSLPIISFRWNFINSTLKHSLSLNK